MSTLGVGKITKESIFADFLGNPSLQLLSSLVLSPRSPAPSISPKLPLLFLFLELLPVSAQMISFSPLLQFEKCYHGEYGAQVL